MRGLLAAFFRRSGFFRLCELPRERFPFYVRSRGDVSRGIVRELIHRLKYGGEVWLAAPLAIFAWGFRDPRLSVCRFDIVVPVPLHPLRKREREFNQAELLGRRIAKQRLAFLPRARARSLHGDADPF